MNKTQQPQSNYKRNDDGIYEQLPNPMSVGNQFKEINFRFDDTGANVFEDSFIIPLYNLITLARASLNPQAADLIPHSIFIHRIDFQYLYYPMANSVILPESLKIQLNNPPNSHNFNSHFRIIIVHPKNLIRQMPVSLPLDNPTFPYWTSNYSPAHQISNREPVGSTSEYLQGAIGQPDPKLYDVVYDDVKNLQYKSIVPFSTGSFTFTIREQIEYINATDMPINLVDKLPQIWVYKGYNDTSTRTSMKFNGYIRIVYDFMY